MGQNGSGAGADYLVEKYDLTGARVWTATSRGGAEDILAGIVGVGSRLFAVGYTRSSGAGGADAAILEINPATGATISTSLFGGSQDDLANGTATDGTDLYVVGESRSFASLEGNVAGQNDVTLLRYTLTEPYAFTGFFPPVDNPGATEDGHGSVHLRLEVPEGVGGPVRQLPARPKRRLRPPRALPVRAVGGQS